MSYIRSIFFLGIVLSGECMAKDPASVPADAFLLDTINVVVYDQEGPLVVTHSDITRPSLGGKARSQEDIIFELLIFNDAKKHKILPSEEEVDKYLNAIQRENNLTAQQLEMVFASAGFTPQEGKEQLSLMQTVNSMMDFKVRSGLVVPRKQVERYYQEHPVYAEETRMVKRLFVPITAFNNSDNADKEIARFIKKGSGLSGATWSDSFSIKKNELAEDKQFLFDMKKGDISKPSQIEDGYELYQVVDIIERHLLSLDERYRDIMDQLRLPLYEERLETYRKELFGNAALVYLH